MEKAFIARIVARIQNGGKLKMLVKDVLQELERRFPLFLQEDYDNSGIQIEGPNVEVERVLVSLDPTPQGIAFAADEGCQLILTHHPLLFFGIKKISPRDASGDMIFTTLLRGMTLYSLHTNYDSAPHGLNDALCKRLKMENTVPLVKDDRIDGAGLGRVGEIEEMEIRDFARFVKTALKASHVRLAPKGPHTVKKVAICSGSGADFIDEAVKSGADVYITGDVGYHQIIHAINSGISLVIVEHDETEKFFEDEMESLLKSLNVDVLKYHEKFYQYF
jgi:dinuclear metal center YbgI/SA1388 family protein